MADGSGLPRQITYGSVLLADMVFAIIEQHTVMTAEQEWMVKRMDDLISRQAAIDAVIAEGRNVDSRYLESERIIHEADAVEAISMLPSEQPEISRIEQELHGKTPEEQYEFLYWLLLKFGLAYTDSRLAVIEWLRGEKEDG